MLTSVLNDMQQLGNGERMRRGEMKVELNGIHFDFQLN